MHSKLVLMLVIAAFATSPAVAATKQKTVKQTTEAEDIAKQHDNTRRALRDALPLVLFRHASRPNEGRKEEEVKKSDGRGCFPQIDG
jgi:hypothetical protein